MGEEGYFQNSASQQGGNWSMSGVILGSNLGEGVPGISWIETRNAAQPSIMYSTAMTKNCPAQNISSAADKKLLFFGDFLKQKSHKYFLLFL